jgi:HD-GYP domain-containing protein (c-di-GMP phosphodiesterase class II)
MGQPAQYGLRSCLLSVRLGDALGLSEMDLADVYYLALLRFAGCTADSPLAAAAFGDEQAVRSWFARVDYNSPTEVLAALIHHLGEGDPPLRRTHLVANALRHMPGMMATSVSHCEVAQSLATRLGLGSRLQPALGQLYERWDGRGTPNGLTGEAIALPMRIVHLIQDAESFYRFGGVEAAVGIVRKRSAAAYDPLIAGRFCQVAERLFAEIEQESAWDAALACEPGSQPYLSGKTFDTALRAMADFVDLKSPYTGNHSSGVAALAAAAARGFGLPQAEVTAVWQAGLLHDLGRVGVSSAIWEKGGRLSDDEWERVRLHPYFTERVLCRSAVLAGPGALAALHHERLDGSGYHRGLPASMLGPAGRILAAADVYHAMTEPRPHRPAYTAEQAAQELEREVRAGRIDAEAANAVLTAAGHSVRRSRRSWPAGLSEREVDVLRLLARGFSNRKIAQRLVISPATVDHHIRHIYNKLDVSTRAAATLFAMQHDLLSDMATPVED